MKKIIGITGGLGAGKSSVLALLKEEFGAYIIMADEVGRKLRAPGETCYEKIVATFGEDILCEDRTIDSRRLSELVFQNKEELDKLNAIVHPAVKDSIMKEIEACQADFIVLEAALLVEEHYDEVCDEVWYIYAPMQQRVKRLYENRGYSEVKSYSIIYNQKSDVEFRRACDFIIDNSGSLDYTKKQLQDKLSCSKI